MWRFEPDTNDKNAQKYEKKTTRKISSHRDKTKHQLAENWLDVWTLPHNFMLATSDSLFARAGYKSWVRSTNGGYPIAGSMCEGSHIQPFIFKPGGVSV